jgi:hypothetical protein
MRTLLSSIFATSTLLAGVAHADAEVFFRYRGKMPTVIAAAVPEEPGEPKTPPEPENWLVFDFVGGIHAECKTEVTAVDFAPSNADFVSNGMLVWDPGSPYDAMTFGSSDLDGRMGFQSSGDGSVNGAGAITLSIYSDLTAGNGFGKTCVNDILSITAPMPPSGWPEYSFIADARIETW